MTNPFELIESRLSNIESLLLDIKHNPTANPDPSQDRDKPMRLNEAAAYLSIARQTLYSYISTGKIKPYKPGKHNLFYQDQLDAFVRGERPVQPDGSKFLKKNKKGGPA